MNESSTCCDIGWLNKPFGPPYIDIKDEGIPKTITVVPLQPPPGLIFHVPFQYGQESVSVIRRAIIDCLMELPEHKNDLCIPKWIGSPPLEEIIKVKGRIVSDMAYYAWERAGKPESDGSEFWFAAEKRFDDALTFWM